MGAPEFDASTQNVHDVYVQVKSRDRVEVTRKIVLEAVDAENRK